MAPLFSEPVAYKASILFEVRRIEMPGAIWTVKRYQLSKYNHKSLESKIKSDAKQHQWKVRHHRDRRWSRYSVDYFTIQPRGTLPLWVANQPSNLRIYYEGAVLYVYINKEAFPETFEDFHESVIMPYVEQYGGAPLDEIPHLLDMDLRPWLKRHITDQGVHDTFLQALKDGDTDHSPLLVSQSETRPKVAGVHLDAEVESVQTTSEEVSVPSGVTIKVKRSRTIEHTVDIDWHTSRGINIDSGFKPIISASIRGEIGQSQGRAYHESESLEYEVALSGEISTRYKLTWTDVWRKGVAEFRIGNTARTLPFRFREWTKLEVHPLGSINAS